MADKNIFITLIVFVVILLLGTAVYFSLNKKEADNQTTQKTNFKQTGNVFKDNPGSKPGVWHLSYERSGAPGSNK